MRIIRVCVIIVIVAACTDSAARLDAARSLALRGGLHQAVLSTPFFNLETFVRNPAPAESVTIYIEGDGAAWVSRTLPSADPTPRNPLALKLAVLDRSANVVYLARPCQYVRSPACSVDDWTGRRFSEEAVRAVSAAIDQVVHPGQRLHLVGYSGGGAIATLLAARRGDVASLRTVAGNLDHEAVNRYHGVSPMPASLNPVDVAGRLAGLPQRHFVGTADDVVPPSIARSFVRRVADDRCARVVPVEGAGHAEGWERVWPVLSRPFPVCGGR